MSRGHDEVTGSRAGPPLDRVDVAIHAAITLCVATLGAALANSAGFELEVPIILLVVTISLALLAWRRQRARAGAPVGAEAVARLEELEDRLAHLEAGQERLHELEERVDFAERLLAQPPAADRLPHP